MLFHPMESSKCEHLAFLNVIVETHVITGFVLGLQQLTFYSQLFEISIIEYKQ